MSDTHVRLLQCLTCRTLEELPDYQGPSERDDTLNYLVSTHRFPDGTEHMGHLHRVEEKYWNLPSMRKNIEAQIREKSGHTGLDTGFYETKATFQDDAMKCWKKHNRTTDCGDYKTDKMRLVPDTKSERKEAGITGARPNTFLCDFCVCKSLIQKKVFEKQGLYN
jgi:hypothetical protein